MPPTPQGKAAARRLSGSVDPVAAAVAKGALDDPSRLDEHLEELEAHGFGDPLLAGLAKEVIHLRLDADHLDPDALTRHLRERGLGAVLEGIERAAAQAKAPFLQEGVPLATARTQWAHAFSILTRLAALERALDTTKRDLADSSRPLMHLKTERDKLRRAVKSGTLWTDEDLLHP